MTQRKIRRINRVTSYDSQKFSGDYLFVFSDDVMDWMGSKKDRVADRTRRKEERKKVKT